MTTEPVDPRVEEFRRYAQREAQNTMGYLRELDECRAELRVTRDQLTEAETLHAPKRLWPEAGYRPWCGECSTGITTHHDDGPYTHRVYWPCPTAKALGMVDPLATGAAVQR